MSGQLSIPFAVLVPVAVVIGLWWNARRCWHRGGHLGNGLILDLIAGACLIGALQLVVRGWPW